MMQPETATEALDRRLRELEKDVQSLMEHFHHVNTVAAKGPVITIRTRKAEIKHD